MDFFNPEHFGKNSNFYLSIKNNVRVNQKIFDFLLLLNNKLLKCITQFPNEIYTNFI